MFRWFQVISSFVVGKMMFVVFGMAMFFFFCWGDHIFFSLELLCFHCFLTFQRFPVVLYFVVGVMFFYCWFFENTEVVIGICLIILCEAVVCFQSFESSSSIFQLSCIFVVLNDAAFFVRSRVYIELIYYLRNIWNDKMLQGRWLPHEAVAGVTTVVSRWLP